MKIPKYKVGDVIYFLNDNMEMVQKIVIHVINIELREKYSEIFYNNKINEKYVYSTPEEVIENSIKKYTKQISDIRHLEENE